MKPIVTAIVLIALVTPAAHAQKATEHKSPHKVLKLACETCHVATSFREIRFDHGKVGFPLEGHHGDIKCLTCHSVEDFSRVENSCNSCHQDVHNREMGTTCERCHTAEAWRVFDGERIHAGTNFPLLGRHSTVDCQSCHATMNVSSFRQTSSRCIDCHRSDYDGVASPNHRTSGFSTDCQTCHQLTRWVPAAMTDHDPIFPIFSGTHVGKWDNCAQCHINPTNNKIVSCLTCHEHAQPPMDTKHQSIPGYSYATSACLTCHPDGRRGRFTDHDPIFPIFSGTHNGKWDNCAQCHINATNNKIVSCLTCHEHDPAPMNGKHQGMPGYSYTTQACLTCHPDGTAGNFTAHDQLFFPIFSGKHNNQWADCATCHTNPANNKVFNCLTCHEHDPAPMNSTHQGMSGYSYTSGACLTCHPDGTKGRFTAHDQAYFPIYSGKHNNQWASCATCHTTPGNNKIFDCLQCHRQNEMNDKHNNMSGYAYASVTCYSCHPDGRKP